MTAEHKAREARRQEMQGLGKPIISTEFKGYRFVAVGNALQWGKWKTFVDFLSTHLKGLFGEEWGNAEIARPLVDRHPILQWYDGVCAVQAKHQAVPGEVFSAPMTGAVAAYFGLSYNLYLLAHNSELQKKLIQRLKNRDQFHGAYYETFVAAWFILAGFDLELENEADGSSTHCEFSATHRASGSKFSVEAKSRQPGKAHLDVGNQLFQALRKRANHPRIVMIDVNVAHDPGASMEAWAREVVTPIRGRESKMQVDGTPAPPAFVIVTCHSYHFDLHGAGQFVKAVAEGFKIEDFRMDAAFPSLIEAYKGLQKYEGVFAVLRGIRGYKIPMTFDDELPAFSFGKAERRWVIGREYDMSSWGGPAAVKGTLKTGCVLESTKQAAMVFQLNDGSSHIVHSSLTDAELDAYRAHPETFFGVSIPVNARVETPLDMFEFLHNTYRNSSKAKLLEFMTEAPDIQSLAELPQSELALIYCERMAHAMIARSRRTQYPTQYPGRPL